MCDFDVNDRIEKAVRQFKNIDALADYIHGIALGFGEMDMEAFADFLEDADKSEKGLD